ncbi:MAG: DeoR/GlpR transcriptional regulator [Clostridiales bacterium]|nr:DeoR/GlpR transcriptional regulator [Clostridiales bacterium]HAW15162.1 DeoR/GlpR transcriptional regulator [Clostridiales bacterium]
MINLERRKQILDILAAEGSINTNLLSERLGVTGATIRTDLRDLAREGAIVRFHGGVRLPEKPRNDMVENYMVRSITHVDLKQKIGKKASGLVKDGTTIFMDASSTAFHMIPYLKNTNDVTVITNGINTAMELQRYNNFKSIILIGGMMRPHSGTIEGVMCREMINRFSAEYYFVSGNGFSVELGLSGNNFFELELKRLCADRSRHIVALIDSTKLGEDSASAFIPTSKINYFITDNRADEEILTELRSRGVNVMVSE